MFSQNQKRRKDLSRNFLLKKRYQFLLVKNKKKMKMLNFNKTTPVTKMVIKLQNMNKFRVLKFLNELMFAKLQPLIECIDFEKSINERQLYYHLINSDESVGTA